MQTLINDTVLSQLSHLIPWWLQISQSSHRILLQLFCSSCRYMMTTDVKCKTSRKLGRVRDGGWDVCLDPPYAPGPNCTVYSFGWEFLVINSPFTRMFHQVLVLIHRIWHFWVWRIQFYNTSGRIQSKVLILFHSLMNFKSSPFVRLFRSEESMRCCHGEASTLIKGPSSAHLIFKKLLLYLGPK